MPNPSVPRGVLPAAFTASSETAPGPQANGRSSDRKTPCFPGKRATETRMNRSIYALALCAVAVASPVLGQEPAAVPADTLPHDLSPWGMFMAADIVVKA